MPSSRPHRQSLVPITGRTMFVDQINPSNLDGA